MFDWNDEELTGIIWGEAGDGDDHIVPYQDESEYCCNKKEWSQEATTIKPAERKTTGTKGDFNGRKPESSSNFNSAERSSTSGFGMGSWADLSLSTVARTDDEAMGTEASNKIAEITKCNSTSGAVKTELDEGREIFQNSQGGKGQGDFVDYSWDNIGSFDDLDQIFSNDDPIFGHVSLGSADGLWSSSKDVTNCPAKSFPLSEDSSSLELGALKNTSECVEVKSEFEQPDDQLLTLSHRKLNNPDHDLQNAHLMSDHVEYYVGKSKPVRKDQTDLGTGRKVTASNSSLAAKNVATPGNFADKGYKQKNLLKGRKNLEDKSEGKLLQGLYGTWSLTGNPSGKYENRLSHQMLQASTSPVLGQQGQLPRVETLQYQQIPSSFVTPSTYGNLTNPYLSMPLLSHNHSEEFKHHTLSSCYEVSSGKANPVNKSAAASAKPLTMTPRGKIEKLRRRQQLQAMLAIQKQQQQFCHQVSSINYSNPPKIQENQILPVEGADLEVRDLSSLPSFDPNSPVEQDDSNTTNLAVDYYPMADALLYCLQDVIAKLDLRIRLSMRDSLFRLAQSAMQRHYASDTSSTNKSSRDEPESATNAEINPFGRFPRMPDVETKTNPIDRTVAHLLFHRPLDLSGKHPETPDFPAATKIPCEGGTMTLLNLPRECMHESSKLSQNFPQQGPEDPCAMPEPQLFDQFKTSSCVDNSEDALNYGPADGRAVEGEASW